MKLLHWSRSIFAIWRCVYGPIPANTASMPGICLRTCIIYKEHCTHTVSYILSRTFLAGCVWQTFGGWRIKIACSRAWACWQCLVWVFQSRSIAKAPFSCSDDRSATKSWRRRAALLALDCCAFSIIASTCLACWLLKASVAAVCNLPSCKARSRRCHKLHASGIVWFSDNAADGDVTCSAMLNSCRAAKASAVAVASSCRCRSVASRQMHTVASAPPVASRACESPACASAHTLPSCSSKLALHSPLRMFHSFTSPSAPHEMICMQPSHTSSLMQKAGAKQKGPQ